jgi:hypothetical protein
MSAYVKQCSHVYAYQKSSVFLNMCVLSYALYVPFYACTYMHSRDMQTVTHAIPGGILGSLFGI